MNLSHVGLPARVIALSPPLNRFRSRAQVADIQRLDDGSEQLQFLMYLFLYKKKFHSLIIKGKRAAIFEKYKVNFASN